jgi:DNA-binding protein H-NS
MRGFARFWNVNSSTKSASCNIAYELGRQFGGSPADLPQRRPYPKVTPKFKNPQDPSQTWSGRGKQPRKGVGRSPYSSISRSFFSSSAI